MWDVILYFQVIFSYPFFKLGTTKKRNQCCSKLVLRKNSLDPFFY